MRALPSPVTAGTAGGAAEKPSWPLQPTSATKDSVCIMIKDFAQPHLWFVQAGSAARGGRALQPSAVTAALLAALLETAPPQSPGCPSSAPPAAPAPSLALGAGRGGAAAAEATARAALAGAMQLPSPFNTPSLLSLPLPGMRVDQLRPPPHYNRPSVLL